MRTLEEVEEPKPTVTAGDENVFATAAELFWGYIIV